MSRIFNSIPLIKYIIRWFFDLEFIRHHSIQNLPLLLTDLYPPYMQPTLFMYEPMPDLLLKGPKHKREPLESL